MAQRKGLKPGISYNVWEGDLMAKKGAAAKLWNRSTILMVIIIVLGFGTVFARLFYLQVFQAEELQKRAVEQQLHDTTVSAKRGSIYDANGNILAQSITVWNVVLAPANFKKDDEAGRKIVADGLAKILDLDKDEILKKTHEDSYYVVLKNKVETKIRNQILEFEEKIYKENGISNVINMIEDYKRYYTHDNFAGPILGFVGADSQGLSGIEYQYDAELNGNSGRIVIAQDAHNQPLPYQYEQKVEASNGSDIVLTIDENIQSIMEKYVRESIREFNVANRGCAIMMNVKTGAILGFACEGAFDPNDPFEIADGAARAKIEQLKGKEKEEAEANALNAQWRNKGVSDTYVPGSVFKIIPASAVLSEGLVDENTTYHCEGAYSPYEGAEPITCWDPAGHGIQTLEQALCNSCNPAFMQIGVDQLGREKFYEYYVAFGFSEKTGIDLPGESDDVFFNKTDGICGMDMMDLSVASFGQNFKVTPIQMLTATAAIANKGKLMQPYVVQQVVDSNGNVIRNTEPVVKRQVISESVAREMCEMLERNAKYGGAKNGYIAGYRIGGKTGTSQKIVDEQGNKTEDYIASFCGIAPCDDPEIALLCYFDTPDPNINYYGSAVAGPCLRNIFNEVLPYLGVEKVFADDEKAQVEISIKNYAEMSLDEAKASVEKSGLNYEIVGSGDKIVAQNPQPYSSVPAEGTVVLYTDNERLDKVTVPDFKGCSINDVNYIAAGSQLNLVIVGSSVGETQSYAKSQDIPAGREVEPYSVVTVIFNQDNSIM